MAVKKPMKTVDQLITHMKNKGVAFSIISEADAKLHLDMHNNYFKLTSYRKNYTKTTTGPNAGKYENLEFAHLIELARLDTEIRHLLLQMTLDVEHFMKVALIKAVEDRMDTVGDEDGYKIIEGYLLADDIQSISEKSQTMAQRNRQFSQKINQNKHNPYCEGLIDRYSEEMPIWAFVELGSFGDLKELVEYYSAKTGWIPPVDLQSLDRVRQLRNACAHGNATINDLRPVNNATTAKKGTSVSPRYITNFVQSAGVNSGARAKKLSNPRINQIVHLFYVYDIVVQSHNTRSQRIQELHNLIDGRMLANKSYFQKNQLLTSTYDFFKKMESVLK